MYIAHVRVSEWSVRRSPVYAAAAPRPPRGSIIVASGDRASYRASGWQQVLRGLTHPRRSLGLGALGKYLGEVFVCT